MTSPKTFGRHAINSREKVNHRKMELEKVLRSKIECENVSYRGLSILAQGTPNSPHYTGPYKILQLLGETNAEIQLDSTKTKIVHLNKLKLAALPPNRDSPDVETNND